MDKLITTGLGGFPFVLDDLRWFLGQSGNQGIYQALNNMLRALGDDFIVYGATESGGNITDGWIMLGGELLRVDAHSWSSSGYYQKVTTYDSIGDKTMQNSSIVQAYQKNRGVASAASGNLRYDGQRLDNILGLTSWTTHPYNAGDYTADVGTWTVDAGDVITNRYRIVGKTMYWDWLVSNTNRDTGGVGKTLYVKIPAGKTSASNIKTFCYHRNVMAGSPAEMQYLGLTTASDKAEIWALDFAAMGSAGPVTYAFNLVFEIQ